MRAGFLGRITVHFQLILLSWSAKKYIIYIHDYCAYQTKQTHICDVSYIFDISKALHVK